MAGAERLVLALDSEIMLSQPRLSTMGGKNMLMMEIDESESQIDFEEGLDQKPGH
jgi:hypothetical protein